MEWHKIGNDWRALGQWGSYYISEWPILGGRSAFVLTVQRNSDGKARTVQTEFSSLETAQTHAGALELEGLAERGNRHG